MKATRIFAATLLVLTAIGVAGWFGWTELRPESSESAERRLRYGGLSIALPPDGSNLVARADYAPPESSEKPGGGPVIVVSDAGEARSGYIVIDAVTGEVLVDTISGALRGTADAIIASARREEGPPALWPVADVAPSSPRIEFGNISYIEPDPGSGIFVLPDEWDGLNSSGVGLFVHNGVSRMTVDGSTGSIDMD